MSLLTVKNLSVGYDSHPVLKDINFKVEQGDYLFIIGENGSGKSTLMKTMLGLNPPIDGQILSGDGLKDNEKGYLPQQTDVQKDFPASVYEIVLSGCQGRCGLRPFYSREDKKLALQNMEKMGITHLSKKCFRELSGGQQQRVLLARALCATGKMILVDEPVSGLDPKATLEMYELLMSLNKEGIAIVMISHDMEAAVKYATHILYIGREIFYGTKEEYLGSAAGRYYINGKGAKGDD